MENKIIQKHKKNIEKSVKQHAIATAQSAVDCMSIEDFYSAVNIATTMWLSDPGIKVEITVKIEV